MKLRAERIHIDRQGYDSRGKYWGTGTPLYRVYDDSDFSSTAIDEHVRAKDAMTARNMVRSRHGMKTTSRRWKMPRYRPHAFRTAPQAAAEYRRLAKHYASMARGAEKAISKHPQIRGQLLREARSHRNKARKLLEQAKRLSAVSSRDRRRSRRSRRSRGR